MNLSFCEKNFKVLTKHGQDKNSLVIYFLRPKINTILEFKICHTKNVIFDPHTTKDNPISGRFHKRQLTPHLLTTKDKEYFGHFTPSIGLRAWS